MDMKTLRPLLLATLGILILLLLVSAWLVLRDALAGPETAAAPQPTATTAPTETAVAVAEAPILPPPQIQALPTNTPPPTAVPTDTPIPTDTPPPTETATSVPPTRPPATAVPPTNTPLPPTDTPAPAGPQPTNARGLIATSFVLQDWRTSLTPGGQIWYEWTIDNTTTSGVPYSTIGVMPRRNGQDIVAWYQNNWGGNNDVMPPEGLSWPSWMAIPERGDYTIRVVVCFDGFQNCLNGGGTFYTLSQEIPVTIR